ncbi:MAG: hypothetical protein AAB877_02880 [Patescibacteria group bacterium]
MPKLSGQKNVEKKIKSAEAKKLREVGYSFRAIAKMLGISKSYAETLIKKL